MANTVCGVGNGADDRAGRSAGKSSFAGASVCCGPGEYSEPGDSACSSCPAGKPSPSTSSTLPPRCPCLFANVHPRRMRVWPGVPRYGTPGGGHHRLLAREQVRRAAGSDGNKAHGKMPSFHRRQRMDRCLRNVRRDATYRGGFPTAMAPPASRFPQAPAAPCAHGSTFVGLRQGPVPAWAAARGGGGGVGGL